MPLSKREQNTGAIISILAIALLLSYIGFAVFGFSSEDTLLLTMGIILLSSIVFGLLVLRNYRKKDAPLMIDYLNIGTQRYLLALFMIFYGIDKLLGNFFDYQLFALDSRLADVSEFQLAWFFYGKNHWQELFTGIMEFVPGVLLFPKRTYYFAAVILLPVTAQVFLLNFFFKIGGITFPAACILLACNLYILYSQKEKIMQFIRSLNFDTPVIQAQGTKRLIKGIKSIAIFLACFIVFIKVKPAFFKSPNQKKYQGMVGVYTLQKVLKNGIEYQPSHDSSCYKDLYIEKQDRWNILRRVNGSTDAFRLKISSRNDSIGIYINKGGTGDAPTIIDSATALKGVYKIKGNYLTITSISQKDTTTLTYEKQERLKPKKWFW